jgi:hypothetical protein
MMIIILLESNMGEVVQFLPKGERERIRLIREARAIYDSVFPSAAPIIVRSDEARAVQATRGGDAYAYPGNGVFS